jgi:hypothetical protein
MHPRCCPVGTLYHKLQTQSSAPEDGWNHRPKHVELIGIINKPLLLRLLGCLYYCITDARSSKHQSQNLRWCCCFSGLCSKKQNCYDCGVHSNYRDCYFHEFLVTRCSHIIIYIYDCHLVSSRNEAYHFRPSRRRRKFLSNIHKQRYKWRTLQHRWRLAKS